MFFFVKVVLDVLFGNGILICSLFLPTLRISIKYHFERIKLCFDISLLHLIFGPMLITQHDQLGNGIVSIVAFELIALVEDIVEPPAL